MSVDWTPKLDTSGAFAAGLDPGIRDIVKALRDHGVETSESCQGGPGHAFHEPTVCFSGGDGAGLIALGIAVMLGLPVCTLRRAWDVRHGEIFQVGWELVFRGDAPRCGGDDGPCTNETGCREENAGLRTAPCAYSCNRAVDVRRGDGK